MKRNAGIWLTAVIWFLYCVIPVSAAKEDSAVEAVSGYCMDDELCAFIGTNDSYDLKDVQISLLSDVVSSEDTVSLTPMTETESTVNYMLMVDLSESMKKHIHEVNAFVEGLTAQEKQKAFYTVAAFGEKFEVVKEKLTDRNAVINVLDELQYTEQLTDPYTGVESALTYLDSYSRRNGDVVHLIIITDGTPDLGYQDDEKEKNIAQSAADRITKTPEVIVSTFCTGEWKAAAYEALSVGKGSHEQIDGDQDAKAAGERMADDIDSLNQIRFRLNRSSELERFPIEMRIWGNDSDNQVKIYNISLENVPKLKMFSNDTQEGNEPGGISGGQGGPEEPVTGEEKEPEEPVSGEEGEPEEPVVPEGQGGPEENEPDELVPAESETESREDHEDEKKVDGRMLWVLLAIAVIVIVGVCVELLAMKGRSRAASGRAASHAIRMKLEVYSGNCVNRKAEFYLKESFLIGRGKKCELIFSNPEVDLQNSRIFVRDGIIYIEDLNSAEGTAIGGMRIQGQNRLRSGDVISIGTVEFSLMF